ncbi:uncharacterized protein Z520_11342 [Fonsecaea multimorphosa CBS 102226]|uniref:TIGR00297 family protein n=1 Tax=Fonsecaea multimorphosa CBS 102226 TaxID=1442371 RepID=A0A0D2I6M5_9EURO|nr:uncharacterized protein Z520_11342 [Fonsecaea multimorphosa CBS 102226]KIX92866.1 hypothetical protein Z520_11342 [Fonsecaea multimorphosa CBS 102226]OAL18118.1 hypothetical protein AYO22_10895 [Fonsecaea multimorphosa]
MRPIIAIPVTLLLIVRAYTRRSLTPLGILSATLTATIHALHPSALPFTLLCVFFLLGTTATKVKHDVKATLTLSSSGASGGEGPRTSIQVVANSGCASLLCLLHVWLYGLGAGEEDGECFGGSQRSNNKTVADLLLMGIMANYAAVAADTLSSELGILSKSQPVLITNPLRVVPRGTNGGVTLGGLLAGVGGSAAIAATSLAFLRFCAGSTANAPGMFFLLTLLGTIGTLLDSLLGAMLQASVIDRRSGKIVEGPGGVKVLTRPKSTASAHVQGRRLSEESSRLINSGSDILDNNQINLLMASIMSISGMVAGNLLLR